MKEENNIFSSQLRKLRKDVGITQSELAKRLQVSASAVGMYEQGRREPDSALLSKLSSVFHVSTDYLLGIPSKRDIGEVIDDFTSLLENQQGLMFQGEPLTNTDREKIVNAIRVAAAITAAGRHSNE